MPLRQNVVGQNVIGQNAKMSQEKNATQTKCCKKKIVCIEYVTELKGNCDYCHAKTLTLDKYQRNIMSFHTLKSNK